MAAKATRGRRDNLLKSISDLKDQKAAVLAQLADEEVELRKVEMLVEKESGAVIVCRPVQPACVAAHAH